MPFKCIEASELYARDPKLQKQDVAIIQEWMKKQSHLPTDINEAQILLALHSCYYRVEATKNTIENYNTIRNQCPDIFTPLSAEILKRTLSIITAAVLPKKTPEGYTVIVAKLQETNADKFNWAQAINCVIMVATLHVHQKGFEHGIVVLLDAKGVGLGHFTSFDLNAMKYALYFLQEAVTVRLKEIHIVNTFSLIDKFLVLVKPFLKKELYTMLNFYPPNDKKLYKAIPKDCLPEEYGGVLKKTEFYNDLVLANTLEQFDFFKWHDAQKSDESKRFGKPKTVNDVFGIDGTFKKLEID